MRPEDIIRIIFCIVRELIKTSRLIEDEDIRSDGIIEPPGTIALALLVFVSAIDLGSLVAVACIIFETIL